jgi:hypothetical protein
MDMSLADLKGDGGKLSVIEFAAMPDSYDCDYVSWVVNLIANSPVAHAYTPQVLFVFYFKASVRARILD